MSKIVSYVEQSVLKIKQFNELAGSLDVVTKGSVALQLDLIQEEYLETVEGFDENDDVAILDGAVDMFVVVTGLLLKLEAAGFNVSDAMKRVDNNNLSKFIKLTDTSTQYDSSFTKSFNEKYQMYVLKDNNGKVRKPNNFKPVDISDCAVVGFLKESV